MAEPQAGPLPAAPSLHIDDGRGISLSGARCRECGATIPGNQSICPCCSGRNCMKSIRLSERGKLYTYSIVHRNFPGAKVAVHSRRSALRDVAFVRIAQRQHR